MCIARVYKIFMLMIMYLSVEARAAVKKPNAPAEVQKILKGIMKSVRDYKVIVEIVF